MLVPVLLTRPLAQHRLSRVAPTKMITLFINILERAQTLSFICLANSSMTELNENGWGVIFCFLGYGRYKGRLSDEGKAPGAGVLSLSLS